MVVDNVCVDAFWPYARVFVVQGGGGWPSGKYAYGTLHKCITSLRFLKQVFMAERVQSVRKHGTNRIVDYGMESAFALHMP